MRVIVNQNLKNRRQNYKIFFKKLKSASFLIKTN